jgi:zinc protease
VKRVLLLLAVLTTQAADIPKHPRDLKYPTLNYQPPRAADYRHRLAGGSTAYLVEDHELPLVNVTILIRTGKYLEPADKTGLASMVGSQLRAGGTKSKSASQFDEDAAFLAAQIASDIGETEGQAQMNCLSRTVDGCFALFFDMLRNPAFADDRLKLAKSQMLQAMQRRNDSTPGIESREFARLLRGQFFTTMEPTKASVESISREDLISFHEKYFYPSNFIVAVSGDFKTNEMIAKLDKTMANWPNRTETIAPVPKPSFTPTPGVYIVNKSDVNQGRVRMGHLGTTRSNPDHLAIGVMNGILGGSAFSSRIMTRVRSDEGLAYSAGSIFSSGVYYDGSFGAVFQSKSGSVAQATAIVLEEIDRIRKEKVTPDELKAEINSETELLSKRFATAQQKANRFATDDYEKLPEDYWQKYRDRLRALTPEDIQRVAQKYLQPEKLVILAVGNADAILKGNPDKPEYQLGKLGTVQRVPLPDPYTMVYPTP